MADEKKKESGSGSKTPMMDPTSAYYLSTADNPGLIITPVVLKGDNFEEWSKAVKNAFRAKKKLGFIDGKIAKPAEKSLEIEDWYAVNSMLVGWIFNTIDPLLRSSLTYMESAKELWDDLTERFSIGNDMRIYQLKIDIANCKQGGHSVAGYYGRLKSMWEEIGSYTRNPTCTCGGCECGAANELFQERDKEKVYQFLMGLDDAVFGTTRSNILSMTPLPNINRVYSMIVNEERHRNLAQGQEARNDAVSFAVQVGARSKQGLAKNQAGEREACGYCGKMGHDSAECFKVIGYPEWWTSGRGRGGMRGGRGGRSGGFSKARNNNNVTVNSVQARQKTLASH